MANSADRTSSMLEDFPTHIRQARTARRLPRLRIAARVAAVLLPVLGAAHLAGAQDNTGRVELGGQVGGMLFQNDAKFHPGHFFSGARLGYFMTNELEGELSLFAGSADLQDSRSNVDLRLPAAEVMYQVGEMQLRPFFGGGIGVLTGDGPEDSGSTHVVFPIGGGVKYFFNENLAARFDARYLFNTEGGDEQHMGLYTGGVSWFFGRPRNDVQSRPSPVPDTGFAAEARMLEKDRKVSIDLRVQFEFDKSEIRPEYEPRLAQFAEFMRQHPDTVAEIEGHTDLQGTAEYNRSLSERRSYAVRHWLVNAGGVAPDRLSAKGYGATKPIADNRTEVGRTANRRVIGTVRKVDPVARVR